MKEKEFDVVGAVGDDIVVVSSLFTATTLLQSREKPTTNSATYQVTESF